MSLNRLIDSSMDLFHVETGQVPAHCTCSTDSGFPSYEQRLNLMPQDSCSPVGSSRAFVVHETLSSFTDGQLTFDGCAICGLAKVSGQRVIVILYMRFIPRRDHFLFGIFCVSTLWFRLLVKRVSYDRSAHVYNLDSRDMKMCNHIILQVGQCEK